jgi:hypothetical protein
MAYIGQGIKSGTFSVLDTSGNTYNGSNVTFSLGTQVGSPAQLLVSHDGVIQKPGTDYSLATGGTQITFSTAPASGASIFIVEISGAVGGPLDSDLNGTELILDADGDTSITADTDDQIDFKIAGADDLRMTANAINVLSGTTLTIDSGATIANSGTATGFGALAGIDDQSSSNDDQLTIKDAEVIINEDSDDVDFRVESNGNTHMLFVDGGNNEVGINTSAAAATLHVQEATTTGTSALFVTGTNSGLDGGTGTIRIRNTDNRATTRGPFIGFDVATRTNDSGTVEDGSVLACVAPNATDTDRKQDFLFRTRNSGTAEHFRIAHDGTLTATDTSIGSNSDSRLKDNIQDYSYNISKFKSFKPRTFTWKNPQFHNAKFDGSDNQIPTRGFVAQELNSVDDYWTDTVAINDIDTADYNLIPANSDGDHVAFTAKLGKKDAMYISIIQQLITRIEALEG